MGERLLAKGVEVAHDAALPVVGGAVGYTHAAEHMLGDGTDQVVLVVDVAVQRHRAHTESFSQAGHGQRIEALVIDQRQGGVDDPVA